MGKIVACPSCSARSDVGNAEPGAVIRCSGCGTRIRVPSGKTGYYPAASKSSTSAKGKTTGLRRAVRRTGEGTTTLRRKSNTGLVVGIVAVILVAVVGVVVVAAGGKRRQPYAEPRKPPAADVAAPAAEPDPRPPSHASPPAQDPAPTSRPAGSAGSPDLWEMWINALKRFSVGDDGDYDFVEDEPKAAFESVRSRGRDAYPYLIAYLGDEELQRAKAAAVALRRLSGHKSRIPKNPEEAKQLMEEWKKLLNVSDAQVDAAVSVIRR